MKTKLVSVSIATLVTLATGDSIAQAQMPPQPGATYPQQAPAYPPPQAYPPQQTYPPPQQTYPSPQAYPPPAGQPMPGYDPNLAAGMPAMPRPNPIRQIFAGTLMAVLQGVSGGLVGAVSQGVTGSITNWFDRKRRPMPGMYPNAAYPSTANTYPNAQYPGAQYPNSQYPTTQYPAGTQTPTYPTTSYPGATTDPSQSAYGTPNAYGTPTYPATTSYPGNPTASTDPYAAPGTTAGYTAPAYPGATGYDAYSTQYYDPRTGQAVAASATSYAPIATSADQSSLYAGVAYEVHAMLPNGTTTAVNAATYEFHTGDKFLVHFRPSLPGRMEVYNVNPLGQQSRIDTANMAAGQLTTLGPYQFASNKGDESLRLVLAPCGTESLYAQTRDIVNVSTMPGAAPTGAYNYTPPNLALSNCGAPATRSVNQIKTRDIQKVAVDGTTSFALDPVSTNELTSGQLAPREITIYFHHR